MAIRQVRTPSLSRRDDYGGHREPRSPTPARCRRGQPAVRRRAGHRVVQLLGGDDQRRARAGSWSRGCPWPARRAPSARSQTSRPVISAGSMSTPAHRPAPAHRHDAVADQLAQPRVQTLAELGGAAPGTRRCRSSSTTAMPTAQASGLPPNVEPCSPGLEHAEHVARSRRPPRPARCRRRAPCPARTCRARRPRGRRRTSSPVRPRPDWISSAMNSTFVLGAQLADARQVAGRRHQHARPRPGSARAARRPCSSSIAAAQRRPGRRTARSGSPACTGRSRRGRPGRWRS